MDQESSGLFPDPLVHPDGALNWQVSLLSDTLECGVADGLQTNF